MVANFPDYQVNKSGQVRAVRTGKVLKHGSSAGYPKVTLYIDKRPRSKHIHRILAEVFIPNPDNKPTVNHKNGVKTDFRLANLEWVTPSENQLHAYKVLGKNNGWGTTRPLLDRTRTCEHCEEPYKYRRLEQRFCSNRCATHADLAIELIKQEVLKP